jgi:hypothetical protein
VIEDPTRYAQLCEIHGRLAQCLLQVVREGLHRRSAMAQVIRRFLADNDITKAPLGYSRDREPGEQERLAIPLGALEQGIGDTKE